tara:strand:- start:219 stop:1274 length:1056 start_codon:yes stop_codon:yes gene_type:complete
MGTKLIKKASTGGGITVQSSNPSSISEFDSVDFIYGTTNNRLYHKVDSNTMAYEVMTEVSFAFSINAVTFRTASNGTTESDNTTLVGTADDFFAKVTFNNHDGTLDSAPLIDYKLNGAAFTSDPQNDIDSHMAADDFVSDTALAIAATTSSGDTSDDSGMSRNVAEGEYISCNVAVTEGGASSNDDSDRYYFLNKIIWGTCDATTGPTQAEFTACMQAASTATLGSLLPDKSSRTINICGAGNQSVTGYGSTWTASEYHSTCPDLTIAGESGHYTFFGWPKNSNGTDNEASTIKQADNSSIHPDDVDTDLRAIQTVSLHNAAVDASNGYTQNYNIYVSVNQAVTFSGIQIT